MTEGFDIRRILDQLLGVPLTDEEWRLAVRQGWAGEVEAHPEKRIEVAGRIANIRDAYAPPPTEGKLNSSTDWQEDQEADDWTHRARIHVVGLLFRADAEGREAVGEFRKSVLKEKLLERAEVSEWIWERSKENASADARSVVSHIPYLREDDSVGQAPYFSGGVLERLHALARELYARYAWPEEEATTFVLSGAMPFVPEMEIEVVEHKPFPVATRVVMTIDPAVTPGEVALRYTELRQSLFGQRHRTISRHNLRLAWFYAERPELPAEERMRRWNEDAEVNQGHTYDDPKTFQNETMLACGRLLRLGGSTSYWGARRA